MHAFEGPRSIWIKLRELRRSKQITRSLRIVENAKENQPLSASDQWRRGGWDPRRQHPAVQPIASRGRGTQGVSVNLHGCPECFPPLQMLDTRNVHVNCRAARRRHVPERMPTIGKPFRRHHSKTLQPLRQENIEVIYAPLVGPQLGW